MLTRRRALLVLVGAGILGVLAAWAKGQNGDGLTTASQVRYAVGNLSTPWLLVGLLAGTTCRTARHGALLGLAATLLALTGFYAMTGAVIDLDGQRFPVSALLWMSANRRYYLAGVVCGLACGAVGAWWRSRQHQRGADDAVAHHALVLTGMLLVAEPLVLVGTGLVSPCGVVHAAVCAAEAVVGLLVVLVATFTGRDRMPVA